MSPTRGAPGAIKGDVATSLLIVQNYWTPYRDALFNELSKLIDLTVFYLGEVGSDRHWSSPQRCSYKVIVGSPRRMGPFLFTPLKGVTPGQYTHIVVSEHLENIFTMLKIAALRGRNYFVWCEMFLHMYPDKPLYAKAVSLLKRLYRPLLYRARGYLSFSTSTEALFLSEGVSQKLIHQVYQTAFVDESREQEGLIENKLSTPPTLPLKVLSMGYLRPEKNNHLLIEVCSRFSREEVVLTIAGDGPERERLERIASDNVVFTGHLEGSGKISAYLEADLFVLPTVRDPWGLVVNEAMHYGLPVICSSQAGAKDLVCDNGVIFDPYDKEGLFLALSLFLEDPARLQKMGRASRARISEFTHENAARQIFRAVTESS